MTKQRKFLLIFCACIVGLIAYASQKPAPVPASIRLEFPKQTTAGKLIEVPLRISTTIPMNAAEFYFSFPPDILEVEAIDRGGSFFELWITDQPNFDNAAGVLSFAGGLPKPGFSGKDGLVATVRFRAKQSGSGQITLNQETSRVLANDGLGTKIDASFAPISFTID
jgi:hypothetical protein